MARRPKSTLHSQLGARVRELRHEAGLSLKELAKASGLSAGHLSDVENGRANARLSTMAALAAALGVELADVYNSGDELASERGTLLELSRRLTHEQILQEIAEMRRVLQERAPRRGRRAKPLRGAPVHRDAPNPPAPRQVAEGAGIAADQGAGVLPGTERTARE